MKLTSLLVTGASFGHYANVLFIKSAETEGVALQFSACVTFLPLKTLLPEEQNQLSGISTFCFERTDRMFR